MLRTSGLGDIGTPPASFGQEQKGRLVVVGLGTVAVMTKISRGSGVELKRHRAVLCHFGVMRHGNGRVTKMASANVVTILLAETGRHVDIHYRVSGGACSSHHYEEKEMPQKEIHLFLVEEGLIFKELKCGDGLIRSPP